ncbi:MAG: glycerol-3-phosphate acyltransferase [Actinobacteria bacterium]|nr:glycerol-3-phosphate acyltransferase [Actinomycetota bacterium]
MAVVAAFVLVAAFVFGYLVGSIPITYLIARWRGHDLLTEGRGGVSGSTAMERIGVIPGAGAGLFDALKPGLVILLAQRVASYEVSAVAALAAVVGHIWPLTLRFRGGRGVGPAGAALAFLGVWQMALAFVGLVLGRVLLKDSAPGALVGFLATAVVMSFTGASVTAVLVAWMMFVVLVIGRVLGYRKSQPTAYASLASLMLWRVWFDRDRP